MNNTTVIIGTLIIIMFSYYYSIREKDTMVLLDSFLLRVFLSWSF